MSALAIAQTYMAIGPGLPVSFLASGGTAPYTYRVLPNGAGGSIVPSTGAYTSPNIIPTNPAQQSDTIQATDSLGNFGYTKILVGTPLLLFCDILQTQLGLDSKHIYIWDQKIFQPTDFGLYIAVSVLNCKPFGNNIAYDTNGNAVQYVNMLATLGIDIFSRGPAARDNKELVVAALVSNYSEQQQEANSFNIARTTSAFTNISIIDGAAIPYRYHLLVNMQYTVTVQQPVPYFDSFSQPEVVIDTLTLNKLFAYRTYLSTSKNGYPFNRYPSFNTNWRWFSYQD